MHLLWNAKKNVYKTRWGLHGCDRMVVGFTTTYVYQH